MTIQAQLADGRILEFPDGTDPQVIQNTVKRVIAESAPAPQEGLAAATIGGFKRFGAGLGTAAGSIIDPELAAKRGLARQQELSAQYAPGASLEKVKEAYGKEGLLSAAGEAVSQIPAALLEQFPNIAATLAGGKAGAMAGTAVAPGIGTVVGGIGGALLPSLLQQYSAGLTRQEQETPGEISRAAALGAAVPGAALEVASTAIPLGRTFIGKILGPEAEKMLARGTTASLEKAAKEGVAASLARGAGVGALAEIPTEVTQQMLERLQAGLPLTTPDALSEYEEAAYGAALVGAPFGAAARTAGRSGAQEQYAALKQKEDAAEFEKEKAAAIAKTKAEIQETTERFQPPKSEFLALPAPAERVEPEAVDLQNPVGNITRNELAPEVLKYVDKYRKDAGMPRLQSFSVEDIRDAMTQVNPKGEQAALDSILTAKTGYTGEESFTSQDVINAAVEKNIAPDTKGFSDFLERTTGKRDIEEMSQPQLYASFKALKDIPAPAEGGQTVLPEGSNASRFTQKQYANALKYVGASFKEMGDKPLSREVISEDVMASAGLESQRAADMLIDTALKNGDLTENRQQVFRTISPDTGEIKFTYFNREQAEAAAKKQKLDVQEQTLVSIAPRAEVVATRKELPAGYGIAEEEFKAGERPAGYAITPEGRMKPLVTILQEQDVPAKIERLQGLRQKEAEKFLQEVSRHEGTVKRGRSALESMEARGETDTDAYKKAESQQARAEEFLGRRIEKLLDRIEEFSAPLKAKPVGTKAITRKGFTITKDGKAIGTFPSRKEAVENILTKLSDKELADIVSSEEAGSLVARAAEEQQRRTKTGIPVKKSVKPPEEKARDEKVQKLEELLSPMLAKFGLNDVALKIVDNIENGAGGSYFEKLIKITLDETKPIQTMRHEALHALKELGFFTPQQWKALEREAKKTWVDKYLAGQMTELDGVAMTRLAAYQKLGLSEDAILEEAIADAFGDFDAGAKPTPGMIAALFKRLQQFFAALGRALTGAGYESAEEIFGKIEAGKLEKQAEAMDKATEKMSLGAAPEEERTYKLDIEREKRKMAKSAVITEQELAAVASDAQQYNLSAAETDQIIKTIKADKKRYPASQGWADLKVVGIEVKTDEDGNQIPGSQAPKYAAIAYAYNVPPGAKKAPQKIDPAWMKQVTGKFQSLVENIYKRAAAGDVNAKNIIAHQTWYKNVASTLRREYGGFGDTLADLLGATSPNTPVDTNWRFSIDVMRRFVRGDFDAEMKKFVKYIDEGNSVSKYPASDKIRQLTGKLYGMNSTNAMLALGDMWRAIKPGQAPKARNFALNLIGQSNMATIDVWAARMLRRAANMVPGASFARIPPPAEQGVSGTWNTDATKVTGAFGFGAEVMQNVSDNLAKKGIIIEPPDLQAIAWFAEKELWGKKGWTTKTGEGGSFEENIEAQPAERYIAGHSVQIGSQKPNQKTVVDAQKKLTSLLSKDSNVLAYRVMQTSGLYANEVEASFDTEVVVDKGKFDPEELVKELSEISKANKQWDIFVSRVLDPNEDNANARPGVEIYFKTPQDMAKIMPILERFTSRGQDGFTLAVDPRANDGSNQFIGLRLQYVPEISMRWDEGLRAELTSPGGLEKALNEKAELLENIVADVSVMDGVAHAAVANYDTVVIGKENYDDYIGGRVAKEDQTLGSQPWFGQPIRSHVERAIARLEGDKRKDLERGVSGVGKEPVAGEKLSLKTYFPTAKEAEDAAYAKAPPETREFKLFQGASQLVEEGRAIPMFHGSPDIFTQFRENKPIFVSPNAEEAQRYGGIRAEKGADVNVYPLYVRAETPFDYENPDHVRQVMDKMTEDKTLKGKQAAFFNLGHWENIEDKQVQDAIRALGFDSFYVKETGQKNLAVYNANQVKSITGNIGEFGESKDIRFSLKNVAYHSGDLGYGRDTTLGKMDGGRSTGHFGTGVYFVGNQENLSPTMGARQDRPVAQVDLSEFNLATPRNSYNAGELHDALRLINRIATRDTLNKEVLEKDLDKASFNLKMALFSDVKQSEEEVKKIIAKAVRSARKDRTDDVIHTSKYLDTASTRVMKGLGFDGVDVRHLPDFDTTTYGTVVYRETLADKQIKYSLPRIDPKVDEAVDRVTTAREEKGFAQRITEAISPKGFTSLRQSFLNRYDQLSKYDKALAKKMGGVALMADQSAEAAALMSDMAAGVSAAAMGYGDRRGGIPVYRNGSTFINHDVKGLVASLAPLAKYGNPKVYQYYQFWAGAKRGKRLDAEGREKLYTKDDFVYADILEKQFPEFVSVQKDLIAFNNGLVDYMVATNVLSPERGKKYTEFADYIPFYRQMDGETTAGPNIFSSISGVRPPKALKGGEAALGDFLETLIRNTQASIEAGMKNAAATRIIDVVQKADAPGVLFEKLKTQETGPNIVNVLEGGQRVSYRTTDKLLVEAISSLNMSELPFMGIISGPANLLRNLVTKDPGFMMANLLRDSLSAYVTSGQNMVPVVGTMVNFGKALAGKSPAIEALMNAGLGGYEFSGNVEKSGDALARDLDQKAGKKDPILMRPFTSLWGALEKGTTASDLATRALVYERVLAETGNETEAIYRAIEVMNFSRKGNSPIIRVLTAAVPFFNARLQGLDVFYRASTGNMNVNDAKEIQRKFFVRGASMMALSVMYYMMVSDDEEYKKQEQETKDGNWIIPYLGIRIPIPFEVGVLFKTMPERITAYLLGNDTGKDLIESTKRNLISTFAFNPIPQTVKPIVEATTNFSFFTMRPIVGQGMADVAPEYQVGPGTSKIAEKMGQALGVSPMKVDHVLKGYTGTMGMYVVDTTDLIMEQFGSGTKANKRFEQLPVIKRFAADPEARGNVTAYYELKNAVDVFTRTSNLLEKTSKPEDFLKYVQKNAGMFAVKDYVLDLEKDMKELREMRGLVNSSAMSGEKKRDLLTVIGQSENNLTSNIQTVKKIISSLQ